MSEFNITIQGDAELDRLLAKIPFLVLAAGGPIDRAVGKAGTVIARRARQLAPSSKESGSVEKQSDKSKAKWPEELRKNIKSVVRRYDNSALVVIGAVDPDGNVAHFMRETPRRHVLWGKKVGDPYRIARNWITRAFDETKESQHAAVVASLKSDVDKVMHGG